MALTQCRECNKDVSTKAKTCPHCGVTNPAPSTYAAQIIATVIVLGLLVFLGIRCMRACDAFTEPSRTTNHTRVPEVDTGDEISAALMSEKFVEDKLTAPGTAKYPWSGWGSTKGHVTSLGNERYQVKAWVDAHNSFGAMIRTHYTCVLKYVGNDQWQCESLIFE